MKKTTSNGKSRATSTSRNTKKPTRNNTNKKNTAKRNNSKFAQQDILKRRQTQAIFLVGFAVLLFFLIFHEGQVVWKFFHDIVTGVFGGLSILIPIFIIILAFILATERKKNESLKGKVFLAVGIIMSSTTLAYITKYGAYENDNGYFEEFVFLFNESIGGYLGGAISGILGVPLVAGLGQIGATVVTVIVLILCIMFLFGITIKHIIDFTSKNTKKIYNYKKREKPIRNENINSIRPKRKTETFEEDEEEIPPLFKIPNLPKPKDKKRKKSNIDISLGGFAKNIDEKKEDINEKVEIQEEKQIETVITEKEDIKAEKKESKPKKIAKTLEVLDAKKLIQEEIEQKTEDDLEGYKYPPVELLHPSYDSSDDDLSHLHREGEKLIKTLESFSVKASIVNICKGPSVTRFEVQPAPGVKIAKITSLVDDIALNLAASDGVRMEAPIPGKSAIGIEIPNKTTRMVTLRELIDSRKFQNAKSKVTVVLGKDIADNIITADISKMPHLLVAGTTGSGKSVCMNSILLSIIYKATPQEVKMLLIDPKMVEFSKYKGIPHLLIPVVADPKKSAGALNWAVSEMTQRYKTFAAYSVRDINSYNDMVDRYLKKYEHLPKDLPKEDKPLTEDGLPIPEEKMPQIVIAIDELADLMMTAPHEVEESICRLAQKARACGMHLVIATQRPSVNVITGLIKANVPSRISLKTSSQIDSRTILDTAGAEKLIGRGDMLFAPIGCNKPLRVQGCFASDEEIENVTHYIKSKHHSEYNEEISEEIEIAASKLNSGKQNAFDAEDGQSDDSEKDPMLEQAIKLVVEEGQASTSLLQRRLRLGYARAGRLVDEMEMMGIVGPHEGSKARKVIMSQEQWLERQNLISD